MNFLEWLFGDIIEFLTAFFKTMGNQLGQGTLISSIGNIIDQVALFFARSFGEPRTYGHGENETLKIVCLLAAGYLFGIAVVRTIRQVRAHTPVRWQSIVLWIAVVVSVIAFAFNALGAMVVVTFGWCIIRIVDLTIKTIKGTGKEALKSAFSLVLPSVLFYILLRAAYLASQLY